jgi:murein DD-endopeptidase MepM/ murein hydrolase activator NlpD
MFSTSANVARASATTSALPNRENVPQLPDAPAQKVAVLPTTPQLRDKAQAATTASTAKATPGQGKPGAGGAYVVKQGDSLAKIARETGTPMAQLKAANNITNESIRVGQTLKVPNGTAVPATDNLKTASIPPKQAAAPAAAPQVQPVTAQKPAASTPAPAKQAAAATPQPYKPPVASNESVAEAEKKSDVTAAAPSSTGIGKYRWPVQGAVTSRFGDNVEGKRSDGINISVPEGTPVKAAENGVVIYAGNGLKELGNTVLIRHDDGKVTVYGNAAGLNVQRGQKVQRGQTIASSGMTGNASRPQLHFEVRKDATPVNPSSFLE